MTQQNNNEIKIDGWLEYRNLVLAELERLSEEINAIYKLVNENKDDIKDALKDDISLLDGKLEIKILALREKIDALSQQISRKLVDVHKNIGDIKLKTSNIYAVSSVISVLIGVIISIVGIIATLVAGYWSQ